MPVSATSYDPSPPMDLIVMKECEYLKRINPLDNFPGHLLLPPVMEAGRSRLGMPSVPLTYR